MKKLKHLPFALIALGLSAPVFADSAVLVPSQAGGFKIGIDALYLRPTSSLDYATTIFPATTSFSLGSEQSATIDPSYSWGVYAQIGYLFPCTANDLTLGYTYLNGNSTGTVIAPPLTISGGTATSNGDIVVLPLSVFSFPNVDITTFGSAKGKANYNLNAVDLEAGQRFTSGAYDMRMFAGLRYADISGALKTSAYPFVTDAGGPINLNRFGFQNFNTQFKGIGPRIGVDARYCLNSGFGMDANLSTALLVGDVDSQYNGTLSGLDSGTPVEVTLGAKTNSATRVVPVLEAKLGVDYAYIFECKSSLVVEAGYQVTNYFNASDHQTKVLNPTSGDSFLAVLSSGNTSDIAFDGLYVGVKYYA